MGVNFPNVETIRNALQLATRAPSLHNSQPWRWQVDWSALNLFADPSRQLPSTDPEGRGLILSCGAALNHCVVALAALGWQSRVRHLPDRTDQNYLASIEVYPREAEQVDITLAAAIPRRRTDRRHFGSWPVPVADIALMGARAARMGVMLRQVDASDTLNAVVAQAAFRHAADYDYLHELTIWSGRHNSAAGIPSSSAPVPDMSAPIPARVFAGPALHQPLDSSAADDHAAMVALGTEDDDRLSWLRAGEATSVVLLSATALGLASCPVTEPLEFAETRETVRRDVFGTSGFPQMLLRVGWAPVNADPLPATPRHDLGCTVDWMIAGDRDVKVLV